MQDDTSEEAAVSASEDLGEDAPPPSPPPGMSLGYRVGLIALVVAVLAVWGSLAWLLVGANSETSSEPNSAVKAPNTPTKTAPTAAGASATTTNRSPAASATAPATQTPPPTPAATSTSTAPATPVASPPAATPAPATPTNAPTTVPTPAAAQTPTSLRAANAAQLITDPRGQVRPPSLATFVRFAPRGYGFAIADGGAHLLVGDLAQGIATSSISTVDGKNVSALRFGPTGATIAWGTSAGTVEFCTVSACTSGQRLRIPLQAYVTDVAFSPDGQMLAIAAGDSVQLCSLAPAVNCKAIRVYAAVNAVDFDAEGKTVAIADANAVELYSVANLTKLASPPAGSGEVWDVAFLGDSVVSGWNNGSIMQWDRSTSANVRISGERTSTVLGVNSIGVYPGGDIVVTADGPGDPFLGGLPAVNIWSRSASGGIVRALAQGKALSVSLSSDGHYVAAVINAQVQFWVMP